MECRPEAAPLHRASGATFALRPLSSPHESLSSREGGPLRHLHAPENREKRPRQRVLDVPAPPHRRALPEVPAATGGALYRLRAPQAQRVPLTIVLPSSATRTSGAALEIVPANWPRGAGPPPAATAFALPSSPAATRQSILKSPACTAVTDQRKVRCWSGRSGPHAHVFT